MARVAVDLIGEGLPPDGLLDELAVALDADPHLAVTVVAPADTVGPALAARGILTGERLHLVPASRGVAPGPDALREVRARRDAGVRVAARLVRDGHADAMVSVAPLEAVLAAARFTFGLVPGATRASAAAVTGPRESPVILCDAGGSVDVTADELGQFALAGARLAAVRFALPSPRVGLLSARPALPDALRRCAGELLAALGIDFVGPVTADRLRTGAGVDVVVTDGFTGDVVLCALRAEGPHRAEEVDPAWRTADSSDLQGGMIVLGVDGTAVRAGGQAPGNPVEPAAVSAALAAAAGAVRADLAGGVRQVMAALVQRRRDLAGLPR